MTRLHRTLRIQRLHRTIISAAVASVALVSLIAAPRTAAAQDPADEPFTSIGTYAISFPVGDTHRFIPLTSWFGAGWEGQWLLRPRTVWGFAANINDFFDATHGTTTFPQGAATGLQNRDLLMINGTGTIRRFLGKATGRGAWLGLGAGVEYVQQYYQLGVNSQFTRSGVHLILTPEAGYTTPIMDGVDLVLSARYTEPSSGGSYLGGGSRKFRFVAFSIGLAEH